MAGEMSGAAENAAMPASEVVQQAVVPPTTGPSPSDMQDEAETLKAVYRNILDGAHLTTPPVLGTPLFIWHLGIWKLATMPMDKETAINFRAQRLDAIDRFLFGIFLQLCIRPDGTSHTPGVTHFDTACHDKEHHKLHLFAGTVRNVLLPGQSEIEMPTDERILDHEGTHGVICYKLTWYEIEITLRFEIHTEYVSLTSYSDFSRRSPFAKTKEGCLDTARLTPAELKIAEICDGLAALERLVASGLQDGEEYITTFRRLYDKPRKLVLRHVLQRPPEVTKPFGAVFADFRGMVLCLPEDREAENSAQTMPANGASGFVAETKVEPAAHALPAFRLPGWNNTMQPHAMASPLGAKEWERQWARFKPLMTVQLSPAMDFSRHEFSVSRLLGSRAMVGTALGVQPPRAVGATLPLFYFVLSKSIDQRQIGRLVDVLSHLGTFRLAALFGYGNLRKAGRLLKVTENVIKDTFARIYSMDPRGLLNDRQQSLENLEPDEREKALTKAKARILGPRLTEIGVKLADVASVFQTDGLHDDMEHRLERARYYAGKFRQGVRSLRIGRLEGYLPYDVFVERRLGDTFEYLGLLAARYQRVRADLNLLNQTNIELTGRIAEFQSAAAEEKIRDIQEVADSALYFALFPYYLGSILLAHIFGLENGAGWYWWLAIWVGSATYANKRVRPRVNQWVAETIGTAYDEYAGLSRGRRILVWVAVAALASVALLAWLHRPH